MESLRVGFITAEKHLALSGDFKELSPKEFYLHLEQQASPVYADSTPGMTGIRILKAP